MAKGFLILCRHADKGPNGELSGWGWGQSWRWVEGFRQGIWPWPQALWSSPLSRARQTLWPLYQVSQAPFQVHNDLILRQPEETVDQFETRVQRIWELALAFEGNVVVCSHQDVVAACLHLAQVPILENAISPLEFWIWDKAKKLLAYHGQIYP